jgi:hypothetical protein
VRYASESTRASRLYWWTAEYGLVGAPDDPKLYGAGLLSSIGEAVHCLTPAVKKLPLTADCAEVAFDITRMQPQLFVARDFGQLSEVVDALARQLAWKRGGDYGLAEARRAGAFFGEARLPALLAEHARRLGPEALVALLRREVEAWAPSLDDDVAILALRRC